MQTMALNESEVALVMEMRRLKEAHAKQVFDKVNKALIDAFKDGPIDIHELSYWPGFHTLTKSLINYLKNNNVLDDNIEFNIGVR